MRDRAQGLTDADFDELKRQRDVAIEAVINAECEKQGWSRSEIFFHASHSHGCYCACPDGPCQHVFNGPVVPLGLEEGEDPKQACGWSVSCSKCGLDAMSHDIKFMP